MTINPANCDRTTVYTGECRNFPDTAWVRFDSGRRRANDPANGRAWLVDYGTCSYWCRDDQVRNLVPLVPATGGQWTREDLISREVGYEVFCGRPEMHAVTGVDALLDAVVDDLNAHHPKPGPKPFQWGGFGPSESVADVAYWRGRFDIAERERDAAASRLTKAEDRVRSLETAPARTTWCPKILLELLRAQSIYSPDEVTGDAIQTLGRVIAQHRPVGPDGEHGDRHTASCGCEDLGAVYPTVKVQAPATVADTKLEDEAVSHAYWVAKQLGCHVDDLDELTLVEMSKPVVEKAERERDEADRRTAAAEADRDRWKLHHDRVDGQWAKAEREVTRLRDTGAVTKAAIEKAIRGAIPEGLDVTVERATTAVWAKVSGADPAVHIVRESDIAAVKVERSSRGWDTEKFAYTGDATAQEARSGARQNIDYAIACEAISRAIEAEQAVDPVEELASQIDAAARAALREVSDQLGVAVDAALVDKVVASVSGESRRIAAHVLGQEADQ